MNTSSLTNNQSNINISNITTTTNSNTNRVFLIFDLKSFYPKSLQKDFEYKILLKYIDTNFPTNPTNKKNSSNKQLKNSSTNNISNFINPNTANTNTNINNTTTNPSNTPINNTQFQKTDLTNFEYMRFQLTNINPNLKDLKFKCYLTCTTNKSNERIDNNDNSKYKMTHVTLAIGELLLSMVVVKSQTTTERVINLVLNDLGREYIYMPNIKTKDVLNIKLNFQVDVVYEIMTKKGTFNKSISSQNLKKSGSTRSVGKNNTNNTNNIYNLKSQRNNTNNLRTQSPDKENKDKELNKMKAKYDNQYIKDQQQNEEELHLQIELNKKNNMSIKIDYPALYKNQLLDLFKADNLYNSSNNIEENNSKNITNLLSNTILQDFKYNLVFQNINTLTNEINQITSVDNNNNTHNTDNLSSSNNKIFLNLLTILNTQYKSSKEIFIRHYRKLMEVNLLYTNSLNSAYEEYRNTNKLMSVILNSKEEERFKIYSSNMENNIQNNFKGKGNLLKSLNVIIDNTNTLINNKKNNKNNNNNNQSNSIDGNNVISNNMENIEMLDTNDYYSNNFNSNNLMSNNFNPNYNNNNNNMNNNNTSEYSLFSDEHKLKVCKKIIKNFFNNNKDSVIVKEIMNRISVGLSK